MNLAFNRLRHSQDCTRAHLPANYDRFGEVLTLPPCTCGRDEIVGEAIGREADLVAERDRLQARLDEFKRAVEEMDTKMTPLSVEGSEFVEMYQVMAGPWHRLLGLARG